jgi:hypothetical protein
VRPKPEELGSPPQFRSVPAVVRLDDGEGSGWGSITIVNMGFFGLTRSDSLNR